MIGATVAIEMPETVSEQDEGRTIGACEAALGSERCGPVDEGFKGDFTARVAESGSLELTIELTLTGQNEIATVRVLKFTEEEPEAFRWQSAGVVVAALVLSQNEAVAPEGSKSPEPAAPETKQPDVPKVAPSSPEEPDEAPTSAATEPDIATIDLVPLVASTAAGAGVALGGSLGGALRLQGPLYVVASGDARLSAAEDGDVQLNAQSLGGSLGLGLRGAFARSDFGWELSARGALERLTVNAKSSTESGSAATNRWGGRAGAALIWFPSRFVGVVTGADVGLLWPPVEADVGGAEPLQISALVWSGYLGLRIRLNRL